MKAMLVGAGVALAINLALGGPHGGHLGLATLCAVVGLVYQPFGPFAFRRERPRQLAWDLGCSGYFLMSAAVEVTARITLAVWTARGGL